RVCPPAHHWRPATRQEAQSRNAVPQTSSSAHLILNEVDQLFIGGICKAGECHGIGRIAPTGTAKARTTPAQPQSGAKREHGRQPRPFRRKARLSLPGGKYALRKTRRGRF